MTVAVAMLVLSAISLAMFKLAKWLWPKPANRLTIAGPAGVRYDSVYEAAVDYIQNWLPDWRTRHYMLPPIFEYKFTEPSGRASGAVKGVGPDCEDRSMDIVFHAVNEFMTANRIPGVVFNSFTMYRRGELLERLLPFMAGPDREKLVKSKLGQSFRQLLADIEAGSDVDACLFGEDFSCPGRATNGGLYSCLKEFLIPQVDGPTLVQEAASAKLMQTLIALWALRITGSDCRLDHSVASEAHAIDQTDDKIKGQKLWVAKEKQRNINSTNVKNTKTDGPKAAIIPCAPDSVMMTDPVNRIFFVTPEQQKVLDGPRIQLIHGPAGTGKSVLIMIKAAQLIEDGKRVAIIACLNMVRKYKLWKKQNGFSNWQCEVNNANEIETLLASLKHESAYEKWNEAIEALNEELCKSSPMSPSQSCLTQVKRIISELPKPELSEDNTAPKSPFSGRSVFFDDATYSEPGPDHFALLYLAFDNTHDHRLWIAADAMQSMSACSRGFRYVVSLAALVLGELPSEEAGTLSVLRSVQRCSTHVFNAWLRRCYDIMAHDSTFPKELYRGVVPGHHFVGAVVVKKQIEEAEDAVNFLSNGIANLLKGGTRPRDIAILCDYPFLEDLIQQSLEKKNTSAAYCDIEEQLNGTDAVAVGRCHEPVSLEWPIVFFVCQYCSTGKFFDYDSAQVVALSRARTKLTVVEVEKADGYSCTTKPPATIAPCDKIPMPTSNYQQ